VEFGGIVHGIWWNFMGFFRIFLRCNQPTQSIELGSEKSFNHPVKPSDICSYIYTYTHPNAPWCWNIYLHDWVIFRVNVGKYSSTMEHLGYIYISIWNIGCDRWGWYTKTGTNNIYPCIWTYFELFIVFYMFRLWVCLNTIQNAERQHMVILECLKIQSVAPEIRSAPNQN